MNKKNFFKKISERFGLVKLKSYLEIKENNYYYQCRDTFDSFKSYDGYNYYEIYHKMDDLQNYHKNNVTLTPVFPPKIVTLDKTTYDLPIYNYVVDTTGKLYVIMVKDKMEIGAKHSQIVIKNKLKIYLAGTLRRNKNNDVEYTLDSGTYLGLSLPEKENYLDTLIHFSYIYFNIYHQGNRYVYVTDLSAYLSYPSIKSLKQYCNMSDIKNRLFLTQLCLDDEDSIENKIITIGKRFKLCDTFYIKKMIFLIYGNIYESVKNNLSMKSNDIGTHGLHNINIKKFIENQCSKEAKELVSFIINNTIYITYDIFHKKIIEIAYDIIEKIKIGYIPIVVINGLKIYKSNMWVSMLIRKILISEGYDYNDIIDNIDNNIIDLLEIHKKILFIIPDDCAYSGTQLSNDLVISKETLNKLKKYNKLNNFKVYVSVPYISNYAKKYTFYNIFDDNNIIDDVNNYLLYHETTVFFPNLIETCIIKQFNIFESNIIYYNPENNNVIESLLDYFGLSYRQSLIYFDHKLADYVSTVQYIYNYGPIFNRYKYITINDFCNTTKINTDFEFMINNINNSCTTITNLIKKFEIFFNEDVNYNTFKSIKEIFDLYRTTIKFSKLNEMLKQKRYIEQIDFNEECYSSSKKFIQDKNYFPLTTCNEKTRIYQSLTEDTNPEHSIPTENIICPVTYYKTLQFAYNKQFIPKLIDDISEYENTSLYDIAIVYFKHKYLKYKEKYSKLRQSLDLNN